MATPRLPFQKLLHQSVGEGRYSFSWLLLFTLDPYIKKLSVKQGDIKYPFFESFVWPDQGLDSNLPAHWLTLYWAIGPMSIVF